MNKKTLRIAGWALGLSMAVAGIGVALGASQAAPIETKAASAGSYTFTFDSSTSSSSSGGGTICSSDWSTALTTSNFATSGSVKSKISNVDYWYHCYGYADINSVTTCTNTYPGKNSSLKLGKAAGDGVLSFSVKGADELTITSVVINAYATEKDTVKLTVAEATEATKQQAVDVTSDATAKDFTFTYPSSAEAVKTVSITGGKGLTSSNKIPYIKSITVNYGAVGTAATINGSATGKAGTPWAASSITEDTGGATVTGATYSFSAVDAGSDPIDISGWTKNTSTGSITPEVPCTLTVSASKDGYNIHDKSVTVGYADVSSVTLSSSSGTMAAKNGTTFDLDEATVVTVNPSTYAEQTWTWSVTSAKKIDGSTDMVEDTDYSFNDTTNVITAKGTDGTIVLTATSGGKSANYTLVLSKDPVVTLTSTSVTGYTTKTVSLSYAGVEYMDTPTSYSWSILSGGSYVSFVDENDDDEPDNTSATLKLSCDAVGSASVRLTVSDGSKNASVDATVTVEAWAVSSVDWSEPTIKVYSGSSLTSTIADGWSVTYDSNAGDDDVAIDSSDFDVKLNGSVISLPHEWVASDHGKSLCISYGGVDSSAVTVDVTQSLRTVTAPTYGTPASFTFTSKSWADSSDSWTGGGDGNGFTSGQGIQVTTGTSGANATSKDTYENVGKIVVTFNTNKSQGRGSVEIQIGTNAAKSNSVAYSSGDGTSANYTTEFYYPVVQSGAVKITVNTTQNSIWLKSIDIYSVSGSGNIANGAGHEAAQKAVVTYAKAFNAAMDTTSNCTTNMSTAWTSAKSAWATFNTTINALSASEKNYAKDLIRFATAQYTDDTDEDYSYCLERAMKTYEVCVSKHSQEAFMSDVRTAAALNVAPMGFGLSNDSNLPLIITFVTIGTVAAAGVFLFSRRRRDEK